MENNEFSKKTNKTPIIIGVLAIVLIVVAIAVGFLLKGKSPDKIFKTAINEFSDKLVKEIDKSMVDEFDLKNNDISMTGKLTFDTNEDLNELDALKNYTYGFSVDASLAKKIAKVTVSLNESSKELLSAKVILQNNKGYMDVPGILPYMLDLGNMDTTNELELDGLSFNKEDYKKLIEETKNMILDTLDAEKFSVNKDIHKSYNGKEVDATEYVYLLDEENQKRTVEEISKKVLENEEYLNLVSKMSMVSVEEIKKNLEEAPNTYEYVADMQIIITTTGVMNEAIKLEITEDKTSISYTDYNEKEIIKIDDVELEITGNEDAKTIKFDYEDYKGEITLEQKKETSSKYSTDMKADITVKGTNVKVNLSGTIDYNANVSKENVSNAKTQDEITEDDSVEIYMNLLEKIKGTSLESLINELLMGLV